MGPGKHWVRARKGEEGRVTAVRNSGRWTQVWSAGGGGFLDIRFCAAGISLWPTVCYLSMRPCTLYIKQSGPKEKFF